MKHMHENEFEPGNHVTYYGGPINRQEIFDRIVFHARRQQSRAINIFGGCAYRAPDGTKCFIGALIPESNYKSELEGLSIRKSAIQIAAFGHALKEDDKKFLAEMQRIHDHVDVVDWEDSFKFVAKKYDLNYPKPEV